MIINFAGNGGSPSPTPTPTGDAGGYQIVDSLSKVKSPKNGTIAYVKAHRETQQFEYNYAVVFKPNDALKNSGRDADLNDLWCGLGFEAKMRYGRYDENKIDFEYVENGYKMGDGEWHKVNCPHYEVEGYVKQDGYGFISRINRMRTDMSDPRDTFRQFFEDNGLTEYQDFESAYEFYNYGDVMHTADIDVMVDSHRYVYMDGKWYVYDDVILLGDNDVNKDIYTMYWKALKEYSLTFLPSVMVKMGNGEAPVWHVDRFDGTDEDGIVRFMTAQPFPNSLTLHTDGHYDLNFNEEDLNRFITHNDLSSSLSQDGMVLNTLTKDLANALNSIGEDNLQYENANKPNDENVNLEFWGGDVAKENMDVRVNTYIPKEGNGTIRMRFNNLYFEIGKTHIRVSTPSNDFIANHRHFKTFNEFMFGNYKPVLTLMIQGNGEDSVYTTIMDTFGNTYFNATIHTDYISWDSTKLDIEFEGNDLYVGDVSVCGREFHAISNAWTDGDGHYGMHADEVYDNITHQNDYILKVL